VEDLAFHRSALDHRALVTAEAVEPRLEQRVDRRWHRHLFVDAIVTHHRDHFLDKERIAFCGFDDARARVLVELDFFQQATDELGTFPR
jgi:hypothetical protein